MKCPTMQVNIDGHSVIINVADFNADTMTVWIDYNPDALIQTEPLQVPKKLNEALSPVLHESRMISSPPPPPPPPMMRNFNGT